MSSLFKNQSGYASVGGMLIAYLLLFSLAAIAIYAIHGIRNREEFKPGNNEVQKIIKEEKAQKALISLRLDAVTNDRARATVTDEIQKLSRTFEKDEIIITVFSKDNKKFLCLEPKGNPRERIVIEIRD